MTTPEGSKPADRTVVGTVPEKPLDRDAAAELARVLQAAAQSGTQVSFQANVWQAIPGNVWTTETVSALITGFARQGEQNHQQWMRWASNAQHRFWAEFAAIIVFTVGGAALAVRGFSWGLTVMTAAASFYFGYKAGQGRPQT